MENLTLEKLTLRYFEMENEIDKMNIQKGKYQEEIHEQYNLKGELWVLIRKKQKEQEKFEENKQKLNESILKAREV